MNNNNGSENKQLSINIYLFQITGIRNKLLHKFPFFKNKIELQKFIDRFFDF